MDAQSSRRPRSKWPAAIESGLGTLFVLGLVLNSGTQAACRAGGRVIFDAATSVVPLLRVDTAATSWSMVLGFGRIGLVIVPCLVWIRAVPRQRRIWLIPVLAMLLIVSLPLSLTACATIDRWLLLALLSGAAAVLARVRFLRWTVLLPFAVLWEIVPSHGFLNFADVGTRDPAYREWLWTQCAHHAGRRPSNLTANLLMPYHGINALGDDLVLLTGEGPNDGGMRGHSGGRRVGSWWLRRTDGDFEFELPSEATGNLWRGCVLDQTIWMTRANYLVGVKRLPAGGPAHEEVFLLRLPASDIDFGNVACDPKRGRVYVSEGTQGGLWEVTPDGSQSRRHEIGGFALLPKRRFDGRLVIINTASLMVYAPDEDRVIERVPAGFADLGFDVCEVDGSVAIADLAGRLRVFEIDHSGHYTFAWGLSLFAARRVAYARDCSRIAVTSADDHRVFIADASTHRVIDTFVAGPALREVAPTGPREFSVTDVCSMTTYRW